jgi:hypothetical protein
MGTSRLGISFLRIKKYQQQYFHKNLIFSKFWKFTKNNFTKILIFLKNITKYKKIISTNIKKYQKISKRIKEIPSLG